MKKYILTIFILSAITAISFAQTPVILQINHKLGATDFKMNTASTNNIDNKFNVSRLEYYISGITIVHDGGTETPAFDVYILAQANKPFSVDLGTYDVTTVEGIKFSVGVDQKSNHLDPASFDMSHPLAPKFPSMHWGWSAGYRFAAIEGKGGEALNQAFQLHCLGDDNYFETSINCTAFGDRNGLTISLDADYNRILENIEVKNGVIEHSDAGPAKLALENFRDYVFSATGTSSADELKNIQSFEIFPNPVTTGQITIDFSSLNDADYKVVVFNSVGQQLQKIPLANGKSNMELAIRYPGMYLISLMKNGEVLISKKLMVK